MDPVASAIVLTIVTLFLMVSALVVWAFRSEPEEDEHTETVGRRKSK